MSLSFGSPCQSLAGPSDQIILWRGNGCPSLHVQRATILVLYTQPLSSPRVMRLALPPHEGATSVPAILMRPQSGSQSSACGLGYTSNLPPPGPATHLKQVCCLSVPCNLYQIVFGTALALGMVMPHPCMHPSIHPPIPPSLPSMYWVEMYLLSTCCVSDTHQILPSVQC